MAKGNDLGITIHFLGETVKFDKDVDGMKKAILTLKKEVQVFNKQLKLNPNSFSTLYLKIQNLRKQQELATAKLVEFKKQLAEANAEGETDYDKLNGALARVAESEKDLFNITSQLKKAEDQMKGLEEWATQTVSVFDKIADASDKISQKTEEWGEVLAPASEASQKFLKEAISESVDYESAFADVRKTVNATEEEYEQISKDLREMATEVPTTASELAQIAGLAGQMGVGADDISHFTRAMVDFGNATNVTAEEAAQEIAQIYNVIGKGGDYSDLDNLLSAIVELGNNTATTEKDIVEMFRNISAAGSSVGMTEQQMVALSATLSSLGLDKGGASAISTIMRNIDMDVATNADSLKEWADATGVSVKKFKEMWGTDAAGALAAMLENLKKTSDEGGNLNEIFSDLGISELRRVDTLGRLVNAEEIFSSTLDMANEAYDKGNALSEEAEKRYETVAAQIEILKNNFKEFALAIGDIMLPYVEDFIQSVKDLVDWLNNLSPHTKLLIARVLSIVAVLSPLLLGVSKFAGAIRDLSPILKGLPEKFGLLKTAVSKVFSSFVPLIQTVGTFIGAHAGLIAVLVGIGVAFKTLYDNCEPFRDFVDGLLGKIKELWEKFKETNWIETLGEKFGWLGEIIGLILEAVKQLVEWFGGLVGKAKDFLGLGEGGLFAKLGKAFSSGGYSSGGFSSGSITMNNTFTISNGSNITKATVEAWADVMTERINENLGRMV